MNELEPYFFDTNKELQRYFVNNYILFAKENNEIKIFLNEKYENISQDFINNFDFEIEKYEIKYIENEVFENLLHKFLQKEKDIQISEINSDTEKIIENDFEYNVEEFLKNSEDLLTNEESAPLIKFVNSIFYQSIKEKASDIHIEIHENKGKIRFRINGSLIDYLEINSKIIPSIISRIKVISNLDIAEKRIPQDGRTQVQIAGKKLDIRISTLPTYYGERVVLRILMQSGDIPSIKELGFDQNKIELFKKLLSYSYGIILVTGPTGSGKSTTLHSFLQEVSTPDKNIITVEDPIEYKSNNINQIQVNNKVGLTFAEGLRSILRQDPDVIMVGEIRDEETARIAIKAAQTGHLVFSTLHTNNSTASIIRLIDMGIEPFLISSSVIGVIAQRLVKVLCNSCKLEHITNEEENNLLGLKKSISIFKEKGCSKCNNTGYSGRKAVGEILTIDTNLKKIIKKDIDDVTLREFYIKNNNLTLQKQFKQMVINGKTSIKEIVRLGIKDEE